MYVRGDENRERLKKLKDENFYKNILPSISAKTSTHSGHRSNRADKTHSDGEYVDDSNSRKSSGLPPIVSAINSTSSSSGTTLTFDDVNMMTTMSLTNVVNPETNPEVYKVVVSKAVMRIVEKSYIAPIQEMRDMLAEEDRASKNRIPLQQADTSCRYPSTKYGLVTVGSVIEAAREVEANRASKKTAAEQRAKENTISKGVKHLELVEAKRAFWAQVAEKGDLWKTSFGLKELVPVYKSFGGTSTLKKAEYISKIEEFLNAGVEAEV
jgi:hypothetical protein